MRKLFFPVLFLVIVIHVEAMVLVETESFIDKGGWVLDSQFMDQMGSPYLLAHGLGTPVKNAKTTVYFPIRGVFKVWVRTYNWISPWYTEADGPGAFQLTVNGEKLPNILGTKGSKWMWQEAGIVDLSEQTPKTRYRRYGAKAELELIDLTGFNGRVDAILFVLDLNYVPSDNKDDIKNLRNTLLPKEKIEAGHFDFVVVGGGLAGTTAALAAARLGLKVALINNRPVLGGNNSAEIAVGLSGKINANYYPKIGNLLRELTGIPIPKNSIEEKGKMHPPRRKASKELDVFRNKIISEEPNISLFLNININNVQMQKNTIVAVSGEDIETGKTFRFAGTYFADCTGDAAVGYLARADFRTGRESYYEAFERTAPLFSDKHNMGTSIMWQASSNNKESDFPILPWAVQCTNEYHIDGASGGWTWESGFKNDNVEEAEFIRDNLLRAIYGNWSYLKNNKEKYKNYKLVNVPYVGGKRESRRLLGDVILNENDIFKQVDYPDKSYTTSWHIDLHFEEEENSRLYPGVEWQAWNKSILLPAPYHVPYRTLYSRNIKNLFMAGRNVSVTHVALGSVRVMTTTAMMGEVIGMAAKVCKQNNVYPRDVYEKHLMEFQKIMEEGIPTKDWDTSKLPHEVPIGEFFD